MRVSSTILLFGLAITGLLALPIGSPAARAQEPALDDDAEARLGAALTSALTAPSAVAAARTADAEAASLALEAAPPSPHLAFDREGIGPSFDDRPNAQNQLLLALPFNGPGQRGRARATAEATSGWRAASAAAGRLEEALAVGRVWLDLAAEADRTQLLRQRTERLDRALLIQRQRLELGEVAGTDVLQLELQQAGDTTRLLASQARLRQLESELTAHLGDGAPAPRQGDLAALEGDLGAAGGGPPTIAGPLLTAAEERAQLEAARTELAQRTAWGWPEVRAGWQRVPEVDGTPAFDAVIAGVSVPLPLGAAGRRQRAAAAARQDAAEADLEVARRRLSGRLESARLAAVAAAATLTALAPTLERLDAAEHSLGEQFRLGAITYLVFIDGVARLDAVRLDALEARRALLAARLEQALLSADPALFPLPPQLVEVLQ